jgi:hypothetical protein
MAIGTTLKSVQITNDDATPIVLNNSGVSGPYRKNWYNGHVTTGSDSDAGTKYVLVRVKSDVKVKDVILESAAQGATFTVNVGLYYADDARYLSAGNVLLAGTVIDADFFGSAVVLTSAYGPTDITNEGGFYGIDKRGQPLWQAAGLSADPGGYFDIVVTTTVAGTGGALLGLRASAAENNA